MMDVVNHLITQGHNDSALAELMGVSRQTIARWKKEPDKMPLGAARKLARLKGYTVKFIRKERGYEY